MHRHLRYSGIHHRLILGENDRPTVLINHWGELERADYGLILLPGAARARPPPASGPGSRLEGRTATPAPLSQSLNLTTQEQRSLQHSSWCISQLHFARNAVRTWRLPLNHQTSKGTRGSGRIISQ